MSAQGSLCLHQGVLWVGRWEKTAHLASWGLDGHALGAGFSFRDPECARSAAVGLAVDDEHLLWVADPPGGRVRAFTLFGREVDALRPDAEFEARPQPPGSELRPGDVPGALGAPVDVVVGTRELCGGPSEEGPVLVVASGGRRRHAVQVFDLESKRLLRSLRPSGHAQGVFGGVVRLEARGSRLWVCEPAAERIQVFERGAFHFSIGPRGSGRTAGPPRALASLSDGRLVIARGGAEATLELTDAVGEPQRLLAGPGEDEGAVARPDDVVVDEARTAAGELDERRSRVLVMDRDGSRVQVFTLAGRCYGVFEGIAAER